MLEDAEARRKPKSGFCQSLPVPFARDRGACAFLGGGSLFREMFDEKWLLKVEAINVKGSS
ncbi:hypothetical protein BKP37_07730 [Anaerobacillus alkalilacustris]|uniref:Uncharacterized protein n=1 Tax=Anaerobacillus alkalilacustris TaxID=393763 RepID=A0A1S2LR38_9BACI|nr:hypothetical protein BKP37_07730 [Anaerobacillus alkalilacustris]